MSRRYATIIPILAVVWCGGCATYGVSSLKVRKQSEPTTLVPADSRFWDDRFATFAFAPPGGPLRASVDATAALSKQRPVKGSTSVPDPVAFRLWPADADPGKPEPVWDYARTSLLFLVINNLESKGYRYVASPESADVVITLETANVHGSSNSFTAMPMQRVSMRSSTKINVNAKQTSTTTSYSRSTGSESRATAWPWTVSSAWLMLRNRTPGTAWVGTAWGTGANMPDGSTAPAVVGDPVRTLLTQVPARDQADDRQGLWSEPGLVLEFAIVRESLVLPVVAAVRPESPAASAGLQPGDILEKWGQKTLAGEPWVAIRQILRDSWTRQGTVKVEFTRGKRRETATLRPGPRTS